MRSSEMSMVDGTTDVATMNYRARFLARHPWCCFCGGTTPAATIDHVPSRSIFVRREWPEGFEFPACVHCNAATQLDEEIVAFLSRAYPDSMTVDAEREFQQLCRSLSERRPELLQAFQPSPRAVRTELRKRGLQLAPGQTTRDVPFVSVSDPRIDAAVRNFARKLNLALFYHHTGRIVPPVGGVAIRWFTNVQVSDGELPHELASILTGFPALQRANRDLSDQYFYRSGIVDTHEAALFVSFLRESFVIVGAVHVDASKLPAIAERDVLAPYFPTPSAQASSSSLTQAGA